MKEFLICSIFCLFLTSLILSFSAPSSIPKESFDYLSVCSDLHTNKTVLISDEFKANWEKHKLALIIINLDSNTDCSIQRGWGGKFQVKIMEKDS